MIHTYVTISYIHTYVTIQRRRVYKIPVFKIPPRANSLKNKNFAMATARPAFYQKKKFNTRCSATGRTGSSLSADGSGDHLIKLQGLEEFSFNAAGAQRDGVTGEMNDAT